MKPTSRRITASLIGVGTLFLAAGGWFGAEATRGAAAIDSSCAVGGHGGEHDGTSFRCPRGEYLIVVGEPDMSPTDWDGERLRTAVAANVVSGLPDDFVPYASSRVWCRPALLPTLRRPGCAIGEAVLQSESEFALALNAENLVVGVRSTEWGPEEVAVFEFARNCAVVLGILSFGVALIAALRRRTRRIK